MANDAWGALAAYRAIAGSGAAPEEFMTMATDAARAFLRQAEAAIAVDDRPAKARALDRAGSIVGFMLGLTGSAPGPLSDGLVTVYRYVLAAILRGNADDDGEALAAGRVVLEQLASEWHRAFPDPLTGAIPTGIGWAG